MDQRNELEIQIEQLRKKMYEAYESRADYDIIVEISTKLDHLLNKLDKQKKTEMGRLYE
ncbi:Spo0E family sporulation regulatory protein-aspartic acid phosphatase [Oceanobacillus sp. CAU 1775]